MNKKITFNYMIDTADWGSGTSADCEKCEQELAAWFDKLSVKTKLAIYYAQKLCDQEIGIDTLNECPWLQMLAAAALRIKEQHAPYSLKVLGHNLDLWIDGINYENATA